MATLRQLELIRQQYEYFANPFYNDVEAGVWTTPLAQLEDEMMELSDKLESDAMTVQLTRPRAKYYRHIFKSSQNVKIRWRQYRETASLQLQYITPLAQSEFLDRHFGWFLH